MRPSPGSESADAFPCAASDGTYMCAAGLLSLPAELLKEQVLPQLSCRALGALLLTCKQLHACVLGAQLTSRVAEAGRALSRAHPLFRAPCLGDFFAQQGRVDAALGASGTWTSTDLQLSAAAYISPDATKAAALDGALLRLYNLTGLHLDSAPTVVAIDLQQDSPPSLSGCQWSADSDFLAWQEKDTRAFFVYHISAAQLHRTILPGSSHGEPDTQPLQSPLASFLPSVRTLQHSHLCHVSLYAGGQLRSHLCPAAPHYAEAAGHCVSRSSTGCIAFDDSPSTLCLWQPGVELLRVPVRVFRLTWSPDAAMLLVVQRDSVVFVSRRGAVLAEQPLCLSQPALWGLQGVLSIDGVTRPRSVLFFAVLPGPILQLQHIFEVPDCSSPCNISLGTDHFAFIVKHHQAGQRDNEPSRGQLCVCNTPLVGPAGSSVTVHAECELSVFDLGPGIASAGLSFVQHDSGLLCHWRRSYALDGQRTVLVKCGC